LTVDGNATFGGDLVSSAAGAKNIFTAAGANNITLGGATSTVVAAGTLRVDGDISADADENKNIFAAVATKTITLGGNLGIVSGSQLVGQTLYVTGGATFSGDIISAAPGSKNIFTGAGANNITIGGSTTTLIAGGNDVRGTIAGSLRVGVASNQVLVLSGGSGASLNPINLNDTNFHVSGTVASKGTQTKGTSTFGGDVFVSGNFYASKEVYLATPFTKDSGGLASTVNTTDYDGRRYLRFVNHGANQVTLNLPQGPTVAGRVLTIINADTSANGKIRLTPASGNVLSVTGAATKDLTNNAGTSTPVFVEIVSDGVAWVVVAGGTVTFA
jgi:hypothetical protein